MKDSAAIGHNGPPDPIDDVMAEFADDLAESDNLLDGEPVTDAAQEKHVDGVLKSLRKAVTALAAAKKSATAPLYDAFKAEGARWKPTEDDIDLRKKGLVKLVEPFKLAEKARKEAAKRAAYEEAARLEREARAKAAEADASNIEEARAALEAQQAAQDAKEAAQAANKDTVKGLKTTMAPVITDGKAFINWIASNDRDAMLEFMEKYARKLHREKMLDGVPGVELQKKTGAY